jgi:DNA-binding HxlR family transcriptional regulator
VVQDEAVPREVAPRQLTTGCPIDKTMGIVGSRSAMLIMREAFYGTTRFDDFVARVDIAPATASVHLRDLVASGLLAKEPYRDSATRTRWGYRLTRSGQDFLPVVIALFRWGEQHADVEVGTDIVHDECGTPVWTTVVCEHGHDVSLGSLQFVAKVDVQLDSGK